MPTVQQVWQRAMPPGTELAAGEAGIYGEVSWIVTLRPTPPGFDRLRGREIALIDVSTVGRLGVSLSSLVASMLDQGVGALGILVEEVSAEVVDRANDRKMPVLRLPPGTDLTALATRITTMIAEERSHLYQREQELTDAVMELALSGEGAEAILVKLTDLSGRTVMLLDPEFEPVSTTPHVGLSGVRKTLASAFPTAPTSIVGLRLSHGLSGFLSPVSGKQGTTGYLLVAAPSEDLQEADRVAAKAGALALAVQLSRRQAVVDTEDRFQAEMMESILNGELPAGSLTERAERLGLDPSQSYVAMAVQPSDPNLKGETLARRSRMILNQALCHARGSILLLIQGVAAEATVADSRRLSKEVAAKLSDRLGGAVSVGVGRPFVGVEGLRVSFQEADRALAVGRRLFGDGSVSLFSELGVYRLLLSVDPNEVKSFHEESIGRLAEYDRTHRGELLGTLEALLRHPTLAETADALHVHRNTLLYRLERIQDVTGLDLDNGETRLMLHLALKAADVIRAS